ncbi:cytochrome C [Siculibacillus lacustris]|uniref:Cytochrome C n=1 Tax=Siculibacillus lacustris TaxID=1549641 RepID=A0A4Q9VTM7_9HYPH|nr:c-type cytochrome [Siculibacillus lacustris]TBW39468.1 cytochrome C [Siculibacillus lacustris]
MPSPRRAVRNALFAAICLAASAAGADEAPPVWAYPVAPRDYVPPADDGSVRHVPGSSRGYTLTEIRDLFVARDWFPQAHPPMPSVVAEGRKPDLRPCGVCHRPEGIGGPENASLAGLPAAYIRRQIADFRSGARSTAVKERGHVFRMIAGLKTLTDEEIEQAVAYYASLTLPPRIRVVETETVPTSYVPSWYYTPKGDGSTEPLAGRIVEMPDDEENFVNRDSRVTFTAHVPPGSLALGEAIAKRGASDRIPACVACHGDALEGVADIPPLAGRSPSYLVRQLYEFKHGLRAGTMAEPMKANTAGMSLAEMVAVAAYAASLKP